MGCRPCRPDPSPTHGWHPPARGSRAQACPSPLPHFPALALTHAYIHTHTHAHAHTHTHTYKRTRTPPHTHKHTCTHTHTCTGSPRPPPPGCTCGPDPPGACAAPPGGNSALNSGTRDMRPACISRNTAARMSTGSSVGRGVVGWSGVGVGWVRWVGWVVGGMGGVV